MRVPGTSLYVYERYLAPDAVVYVEEKSCNIFCETPVSTSVGWSGMMDNKPSITGALDPRSQHLVTMYCPC